MRCEFCGGQLVNRETKKYSIGGGDITERRKSGFIKIDCGLPQKKHVKKISFQIKSCLKCYEKIATCPEDEAIKKIMPIQRKKLLERGGIGHLKELTTKDFE